ncbi:amidohydrolase family protein [Agromyces ramosus]|uniref:TIM-barrel fold metal-dependent hydrolase n=1 Tax=Agromyces ramosus TaxID=33879 RepID=A0ABU0R5U9_9MICO|nr:amidohydrolase family protein [Agromyces ramosus]MDQ0893466.1 putative TIM-barrel fold metal-dependent hydrolase [Agromyces ramosus]
MAAKLSGLASGLNPSMWLPGDFRPVVETALDAFGPGRLLYGSDWPLAELGGGAGRWKLALEDLLRGASDDDRRRIFGDTAAEVYSLG